MNSYRIDGPDELTVHATEQGADLNISKHLRTVFMELFAAAAEDPQGFADEFAEMYEKSITAQQQGKDSHAQHEFDEQMNKYLDEFADEGRIRLYATGTRQLRDALVKFTAPRPVPGQRSAGAA